MRINNFIGGTDEQRSNNLSDNQLINLYPVTNNDGSVAALYKVDGLKSEGTLSGVPTGAYKASNGRAFYTSGTVLYELTVVAGVYTSTSRGTITSATNYEFSDNGLEMIMVNGTDGWIFTFSDNSLAKLTVLTGNFTVQAATSVDVDATLTKTAHGLIVGDRVILTTTGSLPTYLLPHTAYYVLADGFTVDSFKVGLTLTGATCTISNGINCTVTAVAHGYINGDKIKFLTTGSLPASLEVGTTYYVINDAITLDSFRISTTYGGAAITTTTVGSGTHSFNPAITILQTGSFECAIRNTVLNTGYCSVSSATPAVVTQVAHNLKPGDRFQLRAVGGSVPSGVPLWVAGYQLSVYLYVLTAGFTVDSFQFSITPPLLTVEGAAVNTTSTGSLVTLEYDQSGRFTTTINHGFKGGEIVKLTTTGSLPTGVDTSSSYYVSGQKGYFYSISGYIYLLCASNTLNDGDSVYFYADQTLPSGVEIGVEYFISLPLVVPYFTGFNGWAYLILTEIGGAAIPGTGQTNYFSVIEKNSLCLSVTLADSYTATAVTISGTQAGTHSVFTNDYASFGTHTYSTGGSGFPNGAKTISYMNGRFIACDPDTQDFYVSEVLDGKTWDAVNVQTVDSNPDYVTGQIVAHNELVVFCENSGETYYDSGTTPTPFVRNLTGIFEVGCKAPFTIKEIGGSIIFLGNTRNGNGIVYQMSGLTPVRISTYSIEYQIQQMSDISDAFAFTYQKDGHHFYVLTFPTGDKTFVFDASTSLWHERLNYLVSSTLGLIGTIAADGLPYGLTVSPDDLFAYVVNYNGTTLRQYSINQTSKALTSVGTISTQTAPFDIKITSNGLFAYVSNAISNNISIYSRNTTTGVLSSITTIAAGTGPRGMMLSPDELFLYVANLASSNISYYSRNPTTGLLTFIGLANATTGPEEIIISSDGLFLYVNDGSTDNQIYQYSRNTTTGALTFLSGVVCGSGTSIVISYDDKFVYSTNQNTNTVTQFSRNLTTGLLTNIGTIAAGSYPTDIVISRDGLTVHICSYSNNKVISYTRSITTGLLTYSTEMSTGTGPRNILIGTDDSFLYISNRNSSSISQFTRTAISGVYEWPVNKYLYFNSEHLTTDDTTTLFSIDSSTYKNGTNPIRIVRSFRAPASDMKRVAHHTIQVDCEVGIGTGTEPVIALRWSDDAGNTWSTPIERGLGLVGDHAKSVIFRRLGSTKGLPRLYELSCDENVKITLLDCYLE